MQALSLKPLLPEFLLWVCYDFDFLLWTCVCQLYWWIEIFVHKAIEKSNLWGFSGYKTMGGNMFHCLAAL